MKPLAIATSPPEHRDQAKLLAVERTGNISDHSITDLPALLRPGDLLVLNDAATLPASLPVVAPDGQRLEARVAGQHPSGWSLVLFGRGSWKDKTEDRDAPPAFELGARLRVAGLDAVIAQVSPVSPRLLRVTFTASHAEVLRALYRSGHPVQYSYQQQPLELWSVQTVYGSRPWASELPSAGRALSWRTLLELRKRGVELAHLTHAAGLSASGDPTLDAALPLPERYHIPLETLDALQRARRVVAVGTSVVRALEGAGRSGLDAGEGETDLIIEPGFEPQLVHGLLTGIHDASESHYRLLGAFLPARLLARVSKHAAEAGYRTHEFGDSCLVLPDG